MQLERVAVETPLRPAGIVPDLVGTAAAALSSNTGRTARGSQRSLTHLFTSGVRWKITETGNRKAVMGI